MDIGTIFSLPLPAFDGIDIARYVYPSLTTVVSDPVAGSRRERPATASSACAS